MNSQEQSAIIRGAAVLAQQKSYWDLSYQLHRHIRADEDADKILEVGQYPTIPCQLRPTITQEPPVSSGSTCERQVGTAHTMVGLQGQLRRLLMHDHSGERTHWVEYARSRTRTDSIVPPSGRSRQVSSHRSLAVPCTVHLSVQASIWVVGTLDT
jgi:hypothetical protein